MLATSKEIQSIRREAIRMTLHKWGVPLSPANIEVGIENVMLNLEAADKLAQKAPLDRHICGKDGPPVDYTRKCKCEVT